MERRLTTILAADVVGYSRLMAADETGTLVALTALRREIMDPNTATYGGRVVKLMGDGTLMEFTSVVDSVNFAVDVQRAIEEHNTDVPEDQRIELRIGINIGDVLVDGDDIYGDGVNVAARLEGLAEPGCICLSATVHEHANNKVDATFEDLGDQALKNIATPVRAYQIRLGDANSRPTVQQSVGYSAPPRLEQARGSIAVFPLESLSPDPDDSYLADGLTSEIITMLSRIPDLRIASRSAISASRDRTGDAWDMVQKLQFRYVLTGNVRRAGDRVRVIAELSEAADRTQLWSNTYDRRFADLFAVQEEIAEAIVNAFGGEYLRAEWRRVSQRPPGNLDAWGLVQKARALNLPINRQAIDEALRLAREAVTTDPTYAGAYACLASVQIQRVISGFSEDPEEDRKAALDAIQKAEDLSVDDPNVLRTMGKIWSHCGHHDRAIAALRRSVDIAPFDFHCWGRLGRTLCYGGDGDDLDEGQAILDRILASAPNHPMVGYWLYFKANACTLEGRHEDSVKFARRSVDVQPGYVGAWMALANALGQTGRFDEAQDAMDKARRVNPAMTPDHLLKQIRIASGGDEERAEKTLGGLIAAGLL